VTQPFPLMGDTHMNQSPADLLALNTVVAKDEGFAAALKRVDSALIADSVAVMERSFRGIWAAERREDGATAGHHADIFFLQARLMFRHLDGAGLSQSIAALSSHLKDFSFAHNLPSLAYDHHYLVATLGVPEPKAARFWRHVDDNRALLLNKLSSRNFTLELWAERARQEFFDPAGEPWQHMSPGRWTKAAGAALIGANVFLCFATASIGAGLAVASCVAGAGGVGLS
jgi:hypothetical protein